VVGIIWQALPPPPLVCRYTMLPWVARPGRDDRAGALCSCCSCCSYCTGALCCCCGDGATLPGFRSTVQALGPGRYFSPCHGMPFSSRNEGAQLYTACRCRSQQCHCCEPSFLELKWHTLTWRAISAKALPDVTVMRRIIVTVRLEVGSRAVAGGAQRPPEPRGGNGGRRGGGRRPDVLQR